MIFLYVFFCLLLFYMFVKSVKQRKAVSIVNWKEYAWICDTVGQSPYKSPFLEMR